MTETRRLVTKSEFAALCEVNRGSVSKWIQAGYITAAMVGSGRGALIDADRARKILRGCLDPGRTTAKLG